MVKKFLAIIEPEVSLSYSKDPTTGPYSEPGEYSAFKVHFNIILSSTALSFMWSLHVSKMID
jgi:hypothetical protein